MATDIPEAPADLLPASYERWEAFWASDVAACVNRQADLQRLERWIEQVDRYDRILAQVGEQWTVEGSMGQPVTNPLLVYLSQLESTLARTEAEFGMTPQGRKRISFKAEKPQPDADLMDELAQRRAGKAASA
jgi:P27 family predicted phage terminase small subunit